MPELKIVSKFVRCVRQAIGVSFLLCFVVSPQILAEVFSEVQTYDQLVRAIR